VRPSFLLPGIIGGAGPVATSQLYLDIVDRCRQAGFDRRPPLLIASLQIDLAMEHRLLQTGEGIEGYREPLLAAGHSLERAGADFLALPCNTLSRFLPLLQDAVGIPVISIIAAVVEEVQRLGCRRIGLLATGATIATGLFQAVLHARDIDVICLDESRQDALGANIRTEVTQGVPSGEDAFGQDVIGFFQALGVEALVAGCTELKALMVHWPRVLPVIDSLDALGAVVVRHMLGTAPEGFNERNARGSNGKWSDQQ
jgi:aspartate racemase